jgi:hypothetical protein
MDKGLFCKDPFGIELEDASGQPINAGNAIEALQATGLQVHFGSAKQTMVVRVEGDALAPIIDALKPFCAGHNYIVKVWEGDREWLGKEVWSRHPGVDREPRP